MKKKFIAYLERIGMTIPLINRIDEIYHFYHEILSEEIIDIQVTDFIKDDGSREYENCWFFSSTYAMEAKLFISQEDFDMSPMRKRIDYWSIGKQNYDFKKATDKSRLVVHFSLIGETDGDLKASKENCDNLKEIFIKYILPNTII
jgi:hypothetical protein